MATPGIYLASPGDPSRFMPCMSLIRSTSPGGRSSPAVSANSALSAAVKEVVDLKAEVFISPSPSLFFYVFDKSRTLKEEGAGIQKPRSYSAAMSLMLTTLVGLAALALG